VIKQSIHIVLIVIVTGLFACGENSSRKSSVKDEYQPVYTSDQLKLRLESVFEDRDSLAINDFFDEWNTSIGPNSNEYINQNDTIKAVFEIFKEIYKPIEMQKIKRISDYLEDIRESRYVVVQGKIDFMVMDSDEALIEMVRPYFWKDGKFIGNSIYDFRPPLHYDTSKVLYLTKEYKQALDSFFQKPVTIYDLEYSHDERFGRLQMRIDFFKPNIPVLQWNIFETFPIVNHIFFDNKLNFAKLEYTTPYRGGTVYLCKENNRWVIKDVVGSYTWD